MLKNRTAKPWVKATLRVIVGLLLGSLVAVVIMHFVGMENRIQALEEQPYQIRTVVVTPTPEPTNVPTVSPIRKVGSGSAVNK